MALQLVLVEPQIPQNTGSIARTCAATNTPLYIVGATPFEISDRTVKRAGLDYWPHVKLVRFNTWEEYTTTARPNKIWLFSKFGTRPYYEAEFADGDALVFGSETKGLGKAFISKFPPENVLLLPMLCKEVRSLNLSNAAAVGLYEALRQTGAI